VGFAAGVGSLAAGYQSGMALAAALLVAGFAINEGVVHWRESAPHDDSRHDKSPST